MKLWKLTDGNDKTYGQCQWGEGVEHEAPGLGKLCGPGWIHAYTNPLLAVFMNPVHASFALKSYHLWEADGDVGKTNHSLKVGCTRLKTLRRVDPPEVTLEQRVGFAILCAIRVCENKAWRAWAEKWLSGEDRSKETALSVWMVKGRARVCWRTAWAADTAARAAQAVPGAAAWSILAAAVAVEVAVKVASTPLPLAEIAREAIQ